MDTSPLDPIRAKVAKRLRKNVPDSIWELLKDMGNVRDAELTDDFEDLVSTAQAVMTAVRAGPVLTCGSSEMEPVSDAELYQPQSWREDDFYRAETLREYLGYEGGKLRAVRDFRQDVLGGRSLDSSAVWKLLTSPAILMFPIDDLQSAGIDPVHHHAEIEHEG
ncbi:MAG: hypothetical protein IIC83_10180, partial [Chloroflexi bacterium]|nr:hypothetical protein [Chloroflexota bacterium]